MRHPWSEVVELTKATEQTGRQKTGAEKKKLWIGYSPAGFESDFRSIGRRAQRVKKTTHGATSCETKQDKPLRHKINIFNDRALARETKGNERVHVENRHRVVHVSPTKKLRVLIERAPATYARFAFTSSSASTRRFIISWQLALLLCVY
jgi:hypothetical protein